MGNASWLIIMVENVCGEGRGPVFIHYGSSLRDMNTKIGEIYQRMMIYQKISLKVQEVKL